MVSFLSPSFLPSVICLSLQCPSLLLTLLEKRVLVPVEKALYTSREQTFHPMLKWALVPAFFAPGTRETFSPGWCLQPGLKVPA